MDWSKVALLFFFPLFVLGILADKFGIHIGPNVYMMAFTLVMLGLGTICVIISWFSPPPQKMRFLATLFFVALDAWIAYVFIAGWYLHGTIPWGQ